MESIPRSLLFVLMLCLHVGCEITESDIHSFEGELDNFANFGNGAPHMQNVYDNIGFVRTDVSGSSLLTDLTQKIGEKFGLLRDAAKYIKDEVEQNYASFPGTIAGTGMQQCCNVTGIQSDLKFQTEISTSAACVTESVKSSVDKTFPDQSIETVMKSNYARNPTLLWQYFGSEDGTSILFPKAKISSTCGSFDPRFRPFYSSAATPTAKDVIVVIDTSATMDKADNRDRTRLTIAKEAATTVINTLNPNDRMAVVSFDDVAKVPSDSSVAPCYSTDLSVYNEENANVQIRFINNRISSGKSNYSAGLEAAFNYFHHSNAAMNDSERHQVILFLTDGTENPSDTSPLDVIRNENAKLGNPVVILTYGIGNEIKEGDASYNLLKNMSKGGLFEVLPDSSNLRSKMGTYYSFFKTSNLVDNAIISAPFLDTFSQIGLLISLCLPAYDSSLDQPLLGVACADITLSDLFFDLSVFHEGDKSYVFVIDQKGRTLKHPLLPLPRTIRNEYSLLNISLLERAPGTDQIIQAMKRRESGEVEIDSSIHTMARGVVLNEGILTRTIKATYHYAPIPESDYSLCVVVGEGAKQNTLPQQTAASGVFVYHRRDIYNDNLRDCKNFNRRATTDGSIVKFNVQAFNDPAEYLYEQETEVTVQKYTSYFTQPDTTDPGFKSEVFNSVIVSHKAEVFWKENQDISQYVIWRYFGTKDGFIRVYPGVQLTNDYDHEVRPWWRRAIAQRGNLVVTTPYIDAWGAGWIVTFCNTIFTGSGDHDDTDEVEGVLGSDVSISYLYNLVLKTFPECESSADTCMLVDNSGFIVIHPDFVDPLLDTKEREEQIENNHLVAKESDIAMDLINQGVMTKQSCADFDNHKSQFTYRIQLNVDGKMSGIQVNYELWKLRNTNLFFVRKDASKVADKCCGTKISPDSKQCTEDACGCLCYNPLQYDACSDSNDLTGTSSTCIAKTPDSSSIASPDVIDGLGDCFEAQCDTRTSELQCYGGGGCSWCARTTSSFLSEPCCRGVDQCSFGVVLPGHENVCPISTTRPDTTPNPTSNTPTMEQQAEADIVAVVSGSLGAVIVILLIVISAIICHRYNRRRKHRPADDYITPIPYIRDGSDGANNMAYAGMHTTGFDGSQPPPYEPDPKSHLTVPTETGSANNYISMPGGSSNSSSHASTGSLGMTSNQQLAPHSIPVDPKA